jgi:hypothetical protein
MSTCEHGTWRGLCPGGDSNRCCKPGGGDASVDSASEDAPPAAAAGWTAAGSTGDREEDKITAAQNAAVGRKAEQEAQAAEAAAAAEEGSANDDGAVTATATAEEESRSAPAPAPVASGAVLVDSTTPPAEGSYSESSPGQAATGRLMNRCQAYGYCVANQSAARGIPSQRVYQAGGPNDQKRKLMCPTPRERCVVTPYRERDRCSGYGYNFGTCGTGSSCGAGQSAVEGLCPESKTCCITRAESAPAPLKCPIGDAGQDIRFGVGAAMHFDTRNCGAMRCSNPHLGNDLMVRRGEGSGLYAMDNGRVIYAYDECGAPRNNGERVSTIGIEYDSMPGRMFVYRHVKDAVVTFRRPDRRADRAGQPPSAYAELERVTKGQQVATVGNTCTPGGTHLHIEVREFHYGSDDRSAYYRRSRLHSQWVVDPEPVLRALTDCKFVTSL